ncbi:hypothetical protein [Agrococcus sp. Marseille-Q4369]|uniref:hypothetical protein n=1 Tax=Agrococcus sp. Marseille-Q4369 TaxID=2810513 RepID=UPI001B8BAE45|nr:hypothetical protein [Agrococcus sp. Marseille-Q4369]QUW18868.1 hypothetical protein JSQ78_00330 [Agrococcus sp. Marseille-Q4369]
MNRRPGSGVQAYRRRAADTERMVDAAVAEVKADRDAELRERKARAARERDRIAALPAVDPARIVRGALVGDRRGRVGEVVRVSAKTATVRCGAIEQRLQLDQIITIKEPRP